MSDERARGARNGARPFLKWAGGKARLAPLVAERARGLRGRYHEPFAGAAAVFFALRAAGLEAGATLNDANAELVETFTALRDHPGPLIEALGRHAREYARRDPPGRAAYYYAVRGLEPVDRASRAARMIFLNRTGYNGLYRVNSRGRFNVPHGRYRNPGILDEARLLAASAALAGTEITCKDFAIACARADPGDLVYLDPPYQPLSKTSRFTAYTAGDFGPSDQERLAEIFRDLAARGVSVLLSNSDHPAVRALYEGRGHTIEIVPMARAINSRGDGRAPIGELLVSGGPPLGGR